MGNYIATHTNWTGYNLQTLQGALQHPRTNITEWERGQVPAWIEAGGLLMFKAWEQKNLELIADRFRDLRDLAESGPHTPARTFGAELVQYR
jgi:hypothetical protein